jgi:hypothetical protein
MGKVHLKLVVPAIINRTVMPRRAAPTIVGLRTCERPTASGLGQDLGRDACAGDTSRAHADSQGPSRIPALETTPV